MVFEQTSSPRSGHKRLRAEASTPGLAKEQKTTLSNATSRVATATSRPPRSWTGAVAQVQLPESVAALGAVGRAFLGRW